uniref:Apple domain-containing protein n=1 Tax=Globisporangium ultimum (strain ATCC 200006 / CBS 805.95 / DAOM BR144) TaxID=431595 RepID=K3WGZ2_GLOUD
MKPSFVALFVLALVRSSSTLAQSDDLQAEFLRWKASPAGQIAYRDGHVPDHASRTRGLAAADVDVPTTKELLRFENAKATIAQLEQEQPHAKFTLNTPFALLTSDEFAAYVQKNDIDGFRKVLDEQLETQTSSNSSMHAIDDHRRRLKAAATEFDVDWVRMKCVNPPKDQGQCSVSGAFSTVGALESGYCARSGALYDLSVQDVISCGNPTGKDACHSGSVQDLGAYFFFGDNIEDAVSLEAYVSSAPVTTLATTGVPAFQFYGGGVITGNDTSCASATTDSALLIVGYGILDGKAYWKVRNNWGPWWGNSGYAFVERGYTGSANGACGVETRAYWPVFKDASNAGVTLRCSALRPNVELVGETLATQSPVQVEDCCDLCRERVGCLGFTYNASASSCILKATIQGEAANTNTKSGTVLPKDLQQCSIQYHIDYPGNDVLLTRASSAGECCDKCSSYDPCHAFTWTQYNGGSCYMKSKRPVEAVTRPPADDWSAYFQSSTVYKCQPLQSNTDLLGKDIGSVLSSTAAECCGLCRATSGCGAFSWNAYNGGTCWLKEVGATPIAAAGVTAGML